MVSNLLPNITALRKKRLQGRNMKINLTLRTSKLL